MLRLLAADHRAARHGVRDVGQGREVPTSCSGIASTIALPPWCQVAPAGVTAPRTLATLFSEVTTDGACPAAGIQTGMVVSVPLGKPSACSARSPLA